MWFISTHHRYPSSLCPLFMPPLSVIVNNRVRNRSELFSLKELWEKCFVQMLLHNVNMPSNDF